MARKFTRYFAYFCLVILLVPVCLYSQKAASIAGHWEGTIDVPGTKLEILIDFSQKADGSWEGTISIPAQNARNLPLGGISFVGNDISFAISGVAGEPTFEGNLSDEGRKSRESSPREDRASPSVSAARSALKLKPKKLWPDSIRLSKGGSRS